MLKYYVILCSLTALFVISCSGSIPEPTQDQVQWASIRWPGTDFKELSEGRELYISKCSGCHGLKDPSNYTEKEWEPLLRKMGKKAKLDDSQYEKIHHYVTALSKR